MHWNYRMVNMPSKNGGENWFELREVYYWVDGRPMGHAAPCLGSETKKGVAKVSKWIAIGMAKKPLHEQDFEQGEE